MIQENRIWRYIYIFEDDRWQENKKSREFHGWEVRQYKELEYGYIDVVPQ